MPWFNDLLDPQRVGPSAGAILSGMDENEFFLHAGAEPVSITLPAVSETRSFRIISDKRVTVESAGYAAQADEHGATYTPNPPITGEPDFEATARRIGDITHLALDEWEAGATAKALAEIEAVLRQVWNARGAADAAAVNLLDEAPRDMTTAAIRELDR